MFSIVHVRLSLEAATMSHEIAKLLLEHAGTFLERTEAIKSALSVGMPLNEIEEYLDWLDNYRPAVCDDRCRPAEGSTKKPPQSE